ncbi:deoxyribonuclease-2-beta-like [Sander lucioperca]|uniref:deoxyribonuclease-2-beta-like n=1 Tax=Sander lucioperca TaxID=283035 RepID=UPI00125DCBD3|nr:deoxyribonuclease-2-beta-like [Sander lucioperca]XP_035847769.1 deoxyribonuclease-2-beta-like [Sander lucioperca]XP_035847770.1 deoxyribonuclease-2-beta-like [Sander lucioperca]XP_035847771.1 deoxyribonuclease-2-beta-like [Sander lucioperca]XP_035847772.1 deoxyribonuclease-2-beta-like [Sander lucioperca]XP_035847773.1 deoxyribonuclease-2-beta-like [Sander lucioperca]
MWRIFLTVSLLCWSADGQVREVKCRNDKDEPVDWYIIYKAPGLHEINTDGLEYIYIDSKEKKKQTSEDHDKRINDPKGVLANTLKPIFKLIKDMPKDFGFISYSDQPPAVNGVKPSVASTFGHSKGVVMMDKTTGVWLSHSVPQFPFERDNNFWPSTGAVNAQTFICVTFKYNQFNKIGQHLLDIKAFPFDHHIPKDTNANFHKELIQVTEKKSTPGKKIQELTSDAGTPFRSIAKEQYKKPTPTTTRQETLKDSKRFGGDLYLTIAETYTAIKKINTDVRVQTWGQQCYREGSYCERNQRQVINIKSVKADLGKENDKWEVEWEPCNDHSKWCVATDNNNNLICIADVNRAVTQYERPGGALCFEHQQASDLFKGLIAGTKNCPSPAALKRRHSSPDLSQYFASKKPKLDPGSDSNNECDIE